MDKGTYQDTQNRLMLAAALLAGLDLDGFIAAINRADAAGPILDPTLYRKGSDRMDHIRRVAEKARDVQGAFKRLEDCIGTTVVPR